jgi:cobalamin-dependent methionine synthase I
LEVFIQDKKERRFLEFHIEKKHNNLSYEQIYNAFLSFAQQCKRTEEWSEWYNSMSKDTEVKGIISRDIEDIRSFFETTSFFTTIELGSSQVSIGEFYRQAQMFDKNASKQTIRECVYEMFGEPMRPSTWRKADILAVLYGIPKDEQKQIDQGELPF